MSTKKIECQYCHQPLESWGQKHTYDDCTRYLIEHNSQLKILETEHHKYLNMVSDLQMVINAVEAQRKKDVDRFIEEQNRADIAETKIKTFIEILNEDIDIEKMIFKLYETLGVLASSVSKQKTEKV